MAIANRTCFVDEGSLELAGGGHVVGLKVERGRSSAIAATMKMRAHRSSSSSSGWCGSRRAVGRGRSVDGLYLTAARVGEGLELSESEVRSRGGVDAGRWSRATSLAVSGVDWGCDHWEMQGRETKGIKARQKKRRRCTCRTLVVNVYGCYHHGICRQKLGASTLIQ